MRSQGQGADFRSDFARRLSEWMRQNSVTAMELSKWSSVNRETIADAAENRRTVRPETMDKIRRAMDEITVRRSAPAGQERLSTTAMVVTREHPDHGAIAAACRAGTVVMVGDQVEVWEIRRIR